MGTVELCTLLLQHLWVFVTVKTQLKSLKLVKKKYDV